MEVTISKIASCLQSELPGRFPQDLITELYRLGAPEVEDLFEAGVRSRNVFHLLEKIQRWDKNWDRKYKEAHTAFLRWLQQLRDDLIILEAEPATAAA